MTPIPGLPLIFLDIDGVLNDHSKLPNGYCGIDREKVVRLNAIIRETGAGVVVSSAWRYMIRKGAMTLEGFRYMLVIHGLDAGAQVVGSTPNCGRLRIHRFEQSPLVGTTVLDETILGRGQQIASFLRQWTLRAGPTRYVVIDDGSDAPPRHPETQTLNESLRSYHPENLVLVNGELGLRPFDVFKAIMKLREGPEFR